MFIYFYLFFSVLEILLSTDAVTEPDVEHQIQAWFQRGSDVANKNIDLTNGPTKSKKLPNNF